MWIEVSQIVGVIRPSQCGKRPQCRREPCVQDIGISCDIFATAVGTLRRVSHTHVILATVAAVPYRHRMAPPTTDGIYTNRVCFRANHSIPCPTAQARTAPGHHVSRATPPQPGEPFSRTTVMIPVARPPCGSGCSGRLHGYGSSTPSSRPWSSSSATTARRASKRSIPA